MRYISGICSSAGVRNMVNQDAAMICQAKTEKGDVLLAVVCDGMGGLEKGELASAAVIDGMMQWFEQMFPGLLYHDAAVDVIWDEWKRVVWQYNAKIRCYGESRGICMGTTMAALLLTEEAYYICNVGDSRIYYLDGLSGNAKSSLACAAPAPSPDDLSGIARPSLICASPDTSLNFQICRLTRDQSWVQREIDLGRMTEEEAGHSDRRNVLLQGIGFQGLVKPDFYFGRYGTHAAFLLCSDGLWQAVREQEMWEILRPDLLSGEKDIESKLAKLEGLARGRGETDDITVLLIHVV